VSVLAIVVLAFAPFVFAAPATVLEAQDVPPELLLAAGVVLLVGATLAATIAWRLWRP